MGKELLTTLATTLGVDEATLTNLLLQQVLASAGIEGLEELPGAKEGATCTAIARSTGKPCTIKAGANGTCHVHGRPGKTRKVTHATRTEVAAKVTIGFRAKGELARRSAYVVAEALGLGNEYGVLKDLRSKSREEVLGMLAARGITAEVVPASKLG